MADDTEELSDWESAIQAGADSLQRSYNPETVGTGRTANDIQSGKKGPALPIKAGEKVKMSSAGVSSTKTGQSIQAMHKGGRVSKTGVYRLKKGEFVLTSRDVRKLREKMKQRKTGRKSSRR